MSRHERDSWNARFRSGDHSSSVPDPFLLHLEDYASILPAGRKALDIACGAGRHAAWLAEHGWKVTACDISLEALRRAQALASERGVRLALYCQELDTASLPANSFDLIVCFFYLQRDLFPVLKAALRPGGLIVYKTYTTEQLRFSAGPRHPLHLLQPQELLNAFREYRVLRYEETVKDRGVAQLIAQKPGSEPSA
ncbi:MAG: class I SAM-dependent methyltransferase [Acidobacteria bacterium]|nr:class I SAM-dependent methyltransferase [Acidobacteriota bacterium]